MRKAAELAAPPAIGVPQAFWLHLASQCRDEVRCAVVRLYPRTHGRRLPGGHFSVVIGFAAQRILAAVRADVLDVQVQAVCGICCLAPVPMVSTGVAVRVSGFSGYQASACHDSRLLAVPQQSLCF